MTTLTVKAVEAAKPGKVLTDGALGRGSGKLILRVRAKKEWYFRYRLRGRSTLRKLGEYPAMGLPEARQRAEALGRLVREGVDPKAKEREDDEEAHRAAEQEARRGSLGQLLGAYVAALRAQGKVSARGVELLFNRAVVKPFPGLAARKAADIGPERYSTNPRPPTRPGTDARRECAPLLSPGGVSVRERAGLGPRGARA